MMERKIVIERINKIKSQEADFKSKYWADVYFGTDSFTMHISKIDLESLNSLDLVRCFEFVVRMHVDIVERRVSAQYFKD